MSLHSARLPDLVVIGGASGVAGQLLPLSSLGGEIQFLAGRLRCDLPHGTAVGLLFPTSADLVIHWLACLLAGLQPLILSYPSQKLNHAYWGEQLLATVADAGLAAIIADRAGQPIAAAGMVRVIPAVALADLPASPGAHFVLHDFAILQQSSGTTGHRRAIRFEAAALRRHVADYNAVLRLTQADRIVSWLPLYHDMGAIGCLVMPLMLGVPVVMLDPTEWVRKPGLLFEAIEHHQGSVCYMPNFGFEVMAREPAPPMKRMRAWISCGEPVSAATARRFLSHTGTPEQSFFPCYAMAENIFAISMRQGIQTRDADGVEQISCGAPIPGVDVRVVDGQLLVGSPTAFASYLSGGDLRGEDGFYATGDVGSIIDGEIYVAGRVQDVLIQAGRKFLLSDIDLILNRLYPGIRGRGAAVALPDARLGTEQLVILIEADDFWARMDAPQIVALLRSATGIDHAAVFFVPPRFLTKTSSGKFNRKRIGADWLAALAHQKRRAGASAHYPADDLARSFAAADWTRPVCEALDSLSLTVLRVLLNEAGLPENPRATLADIQSAMQDRAPAPTAPDWGNTLRIVSLADGATFRGSLRRAELARLARRFGRPVSFEQLCLPPTPVLLSDLIFNDWFQPRLDQAPFSAVDALLAKLRAADVVILDDRAEILLVWPQVYGALSHLCQRDPRADLLMTRWQRYALHHDQLPLTVATGAYLHPDDRAATHMQFAAYLGTKLFRVATNEGASEWTRDWEYTDLRRGQDKAVDAERFITALGDFVERNVELPGEPSGGRLDITFTRAELGHYCAAMAHQGVVERLAESFDRVCIAGQASSLPHLRKLLDKAGKEWCLVPSFAPEIMERLAGEYDCLVLCGAWGCHDAGMTTVAMMFANKNEFADNAAAGEAWADVRPSIRPAPGEDWFYPFPLVRISELLLKEARLENSRRLEKGFFFEKKKQKTFASGDTL